MQTTIKKAVISLLLAAPVVAGSAQTQRNAYFLDRYAYRWQLNPALLPDWGFVSFTPLGHWGLDVQTNFGLSDLLYPRDGKIYTFMDEKSVSVKEFSSKMPHTANVRFNMSMNILSFGFFAWGGYNVFGLDLTNNLRLEIPKDLFMLPKRNIGSSYDLSGLGVRDEAYVTLSLGHARNLESIEPTLKDLTVGATLKVLLGAASLQARLSDSYASLANDPDLKKIIYAKLNAEAMAAAFFKINAAKNADSTLNTDKILDNISFNGLAGWGLGIDLGASYDMTNILKDKLPDGHKLTLSAAITDLAFIRWKDQLSARTKNDNEIGIKVFDKISDDTSFKVNNYLPKSEDWDGIQKLYQEDNASRSTALNANLRLGAEYWVHKYISFGLLSTTRFSGWATLTELMVTANIKPKWFNFVLNTSISNWGPSWGLYLGWSPRYFANLFLSVDWLPYRYAGMFGIPRDNVSVSINAGASIPLNWNPARKPGAKAAEEHSSSMGNALDGGNAIEWQKLNNDKTAGRIKKNPVTIKGAQEIDEAENKELKRLNKPIAD